MRLFLLTALTMLAFATNSILNRVAIRIEGADALAFAALRLAAGAGVLVVLRRFDLGAAGPLYAARRLAAAGCLLTYMLGFSLAYQKLDAGTGALILFGGVQLTMFGGAFLAGEPIGRQRLIGAVIAFCGLIWLVAPGRSTALDPVAVLLMALAAVGWGAYSLLGRADTAPLAATAASFLLAAVPATLFAVAVPGADLGRGFGLGVGPGLSPIAIGLALVSGGVTSGLGYALWYHLLPQLGASRAAVAQLTVPVIALALGVLVLGERPDTTALMATVVVLAGVAVSLFRRR